MIRVVVADDQELVRAGFRMLIDAADDIQVVGEAATGTEAVNVTLSQKPDVVLMDVRMPGQDGIAATREILSSGGSDVTKVIILTTFDLDEYVHEAIQIGASGFLLKDTPPAQLLEAIRVVAGGEALLAPSVTRRLIEEFVRRTPAAQKRVGELDMLTAREKEVLALVGKGFSNVEIADQLVLSPATAKTHVSRIMTKLHARDRAQLVVLAYESGLIEPGSR